MSNEYWTNQLISEIEANSIAQTKALLEFGVSVDEPNFCGETPLCVAAKRGRVVIAKGLLERGAAINSSGMNGRTPLLQATKAGRVSMVQLLLEHGADTEIRDEQGYSPLIVAAFNDHQRLVRLLLECGSDPDLTTTCGSTALMLAAHNTQKATVEILLSYDALLPTSGQRKKLEPDALRCIDEAAECRALAVQWALEQVHGTPRDITQLFWKIAGLAEIYIPERPGHARPTKRARLR